MNATAVSAVPGAGTYVLFTFALRTELVAPSFLIAVGHGGTEPNSTGILGCPKDLRSEPDILVPLPDAEVLDVEGASCSLRAFLDPGPGQAPRDRRIPSGLFWIHGDIFWIPSGLFWIPN